MRHHTLLTPNDLADIVEQAWDKATHEARRPHRQLDHFMKDFASQLRRAQREMEDESTGEETRR